MPKNSYADAKLKTWHNVQRAGFADWVREDKAFQDLLSGLVERFGVVDVVPAPETTYVPLREFSQDPDQKLGGRRK